MAETLPIDLLFFIHLMTNEFYRVTRFRFGKFTNGQVQCKLTINFLSIFGIQYLIFYCNLVVIFNNIKPTKTPTIVGTIYERKLHST